jgi:aminoglycoside/choline kinase family phosphotransferase
MSVNMNKEENLLLDLYNKTFSTQATGIAALPVSGSYRKYYRLEGAGSTVIGVCNEDRKENEAFISFTKHFLKNNLPVPQVIAIDKKNPIYLLSDLGDLTLFGLITEVRGDRFEFPDEMLEIYRKVISLLPRFQIEAGRSLDFSRCYPRPAFDRQSMMWDLNYFKYYFLKLAKVPFDEQKLEDDFTTLTDWLLTADCTNFMYRDFQSRNIMLVGSEPWFIDYQGGRKGPLHYDIASLLYDAKAAVPEAVREELLRRYLDEVNQYSKVNAGEFMQLYYGFVLIRILQAMGAYGFRGYYENKAHFLQSIPFAVNNLQDLLEKHPLPVKIPMLASVLENIISNKDFRHAEVKQNSLVVSVFSFSYKNGIPVDQHGHGGGFVFDCRALPNPGKLDLYKNSTGKDADVIGFLKKEPPVDEFLRYVFNIVDQSVNRYIERNFGNLYVAFGCTGGQHRSVYCAEALTRHLREKFSVRVDLVHKESGNHPTKK